MGEGRLEFARSGGNVHRAPMGKGTYFHVNDKRAKITAVARPVPEERLLFIPYVDMAC